VVFDRVEHSETGIGIVPRKEHHLNRAHALRKTIVEAKEAPDKGEGNAGPKDHVLVSALVIPIAFNAAFSVNTVRLGKVEQRAGGDGDYELLLDRIGHAAIHSPARME